MKPFEWFEERPFSPRLTLEEYEAEMAAETVYVLSGTRRGQRATCTRCGKVYLPGAGHFGSDMCLVGVARQRQHQRGYLPCPQEFAEVLFHSGIGVVLDYFSDVEKEWHVKSEDRIYRGVIAGKFPYAEKWAVKVLQAYRASATSASAERALPFVLVAFAPYALDISQDVFCDVFHGHMAPTVRGLLTAFAALEHECASDDKIVDVMQRCVRDVLAHARAKKKTAPAAESEAVQAPREEPPWDNSPEEIASYVRAPRRQSRVVRGGK